MGGGGLGLGLGEKKCQRGGRDEEGKGVLGKIGDEDTREHGERASGKKRTRGYGRGFLIGIDKPTFFGIRMYIFK